MPGNLAFIPGTPALHPGPLSRYLPPIPTGVVSAWLAEQGRLESRGPAAAWVLDPFGISPQVAVEAARAGFRVLVAANFTENSQPVAANELRLYGLDYRFRDLISGKDIVLGEEPLVLEPYQVIWLANLN
jgi:hypothetical protein